MGRISQKSSSWNYLQGVESFQEWIVESRGSLVCNLSDSPSVSDTRVHLLYHSMLDELRLFLPSFFLYPCPHPSLSHSRVLSASFLLKSLSFFPSFGDLDQDNFYKEAACYISRVAWDALNSVLRPMLMRGEKAMGD